MNARYSVSTAQADLCIGFILDNDDEGSIVLSVPSDLRKAAHDYQEAPIGNAGHAAIEAAREAIERWLLTDREACVAVLGPGLDIEQ